MGEAPFPVHLDEEPAGGNEGIDVGNATLQKT
jgi:hypothetical protein